MSYIDCEKCIHYRICCGYTSKEAIAESNRAMNNGESLLCFMYAPTADVVEVRHGEWKYNERGGYVCSECNCWLEDYYGATPEMMKYCFKCGAKMDRERSENGKS